LKQKIFRKIFKKKHGVGVAELKIAADFIRGTGPGSLSEPKCDQLNGAPSNASVRHGWHEKGVSFFLRGVRANLKQPFSMGFLRILPSC
jgi:hypothetical protein